MANNVQQYQQQQAVSSQQQQQQGNSSPHHCKECGIYMNSAESLEVHFKYHKENLLNKWATQTTATPTGGGHPSEETNNNTTNKVQIKREPADSSDSMLMKKNSPEYGSGHRATPEMNVNFGHPPTPQSYHSASSPYQTPDNSATAFSPGFQNHFPPQVKTERPQSPIGQHFNQQQQNYQSYPPPPDAAGQQQFYAMGDGYNQQEYVHKMSGQQNNGFGGGNRYHPYQQQHNSHHQVSSSSPAYPPQPTPSPSPKQCDKCGYVCESATQLIEHLNVAHPPTPAPHLTGNSYQQNHFIFGPNGGDPIKTEEADVQSEILDLDSHKVVHQVYQDEQDGKSITMGGDLKGPQNPHSVTAMLNQWPQQPSPQQQKMFPGAFPNENKMQFDGPKVFHNQMGQQPDFLPNPMMQQEQMSYRPFEHMPPQPTPPLITSTQVPTPNNVQTPPVNPKSTSWKSNEARRPKTYNCTACNKWFTSSGHLKRHYNTTLHKNAVKTSGQPDPASLPISAHHHPARDVNSSREDHSNSPGEDSRSEDGLNSSSGSYERAGPGMTGLLQQPPAGPYDRQPGPPNIHHPMHSPMAGHNTNTLPASPPNGEAGPSASNIDSRGLLSTINSSNQQQQQQQHHPHGFNMMGPMDSHHHQFQMYPNECAPHVTQVTAAITSSLNTTGEFQVVEFQSPSPTQQHHREQAKVSTIQSTQPLPSFAQFNNKYGLLVGYNVANVGGPGPVTAPLTYYTIEADQHQQQQVFHHHQLQQQQQPQQQEDNYKLTVLTPMTTDQFVQYAPGNNKMIDLIERQTNTLEDIKPKFEIQPASPEKAHIKRDYEESTGSPQITSTSNNNNNNNNNISNNNNTAIMQVSKDGLHKCFDCDKVFNKSCYLTQHNKTFHSGDKPFKCTRCGKRFSSDDQYQEHLTKHAGDKPHKCELCPKQFNHKTDLRRHMCLHTGQKPYACDTCGKGFIRKDHMLKHCETHAKKEKTHSKNNNNNSAIQARG